MTKGDIVLRRWQGSTESLAEYFVLRYFGKNVDVCWVADEIGGVLSVSDYFFDTNDIVDFIKYKYSSAQLFEYYDYQLDAMTKEVFVVSIKKWKWFTPPPETQ